MAYRFRRNFNREDKDPFRQSREARSFDIVTAPIRLLAKWGMSDYNPIDLSVKFYKKYFAKEDPDLDDEGNRLDLDELEREARRRQDAERQAFSYTPGVMEDLVTGCGNSVAPVAEVSAQPSEQAIPPQTVGIQSAEVQLTETLSQSEEILPADILAGIQTLIQSVKSAEIPSVQTDASSLFSPYSGVYDQDEGNPSN